VSISLTVTASPQAGRAVVALPRAAAGILGLRSGQSVRVQLGRRTAGARVRVVAGEAELRFPPGLARTLALPDPARRLALRARRVRERLHLGPVIGIFVERARPGPRPFGRMTPMIDQLCRLGRRRGYLVYAFTPADVHWDRQRVLGWYPQGDGWVRRPLPFPDVVYDRVASRTAARQPAVRLAQARLLQEVGHRYFNRRFFDKWEVHRVLRGDPRLAPHLPPTERLAGPGHLERRLRDWGRVWIKPSGGSLGRGIVVVRRGPGTGVTMLRPAGPGWRARRVRSAAALRRALAGILRRGDYVLQAELDLARFQGRPFDIRVLMQRTGSGRWRRTKVYARVAPPGGLTANIAQGGRGLPLGTVLAGASGEVPARRDQILQTLRRLCWDLVEALEQGTGERLGEVALDLGVDGRGHVWFIEANSKPVRAVETVTGSMQVVRRALERPLAYAAHLAGFPSG